jgi:ParB family chromosome partitioning protein
VSPAPRKRGLGRGLDALIQAEPARTLPIDALEPNRFQPRTAFDDARLDELVDSIRAQGVVQPLVVTARGGGAYTIIAGERRWRAARKAGLTEVPVVVREISGDRELLELALVENLQRADLNPLEEAEAYRTLATTFDLSQEEIAARVGKSRPAVANALRLLNLPPEIQDELRSGRLTPGQARPLLAITDPLRQLALAREAVERGLSARDLEARARGARSGAGPRRPRAAEPAEPEVFAAAAQEKLTKRLQTRVEIRRAGRGGTIRIHFHAEEELMRLYEHLMERGASR